jgi:hypothetical protein
MGNELPEDSKSGSVRSNTKKYKIRCHELVLCEIPKFEDVKDEITLEDYKILYDEEEIIKRSRTYIVSASSEEDAIKFAFALNGGFPDYWNCVSSSDTVIDESGMGTLELARMYCEVLEVLHV